MGPLLPLHPLVWCQRAVVGAAPPFLPVQAAKKPDSGGKASDTPAPAKPAPQIAASPPPRVAAPVRATPQSPTGKAAAAPVPADDVVEAETPKRTTADGRRRRASAHPARGEDVSPSASDPSGWPGVAPFGGYGFWWW